jgi:succinoglycan biosynthesis protein ExoV
MRPHIFRPDGATNFGDELNLLLWDHLLPQLSKAGPGLFFGVGTVLTEPLPIERPIIVFGSGAGYGPVPALNGVELRFVRGPRTAALTGAPWITDPAILIRHIVKRASTPYIKVGFVPHWQTMAVDTTMAERFAPLGITVIDPMGPVMQVLQAIAGCELVVAEAMHGAIVADALRIPWIPTFLTSQHIFKWFDWCQSMELPYEPQPLDICPLPWIIEHGERFLSDSLVCDTKLRTIDKALDDLRYDLELGNFR